MPLIILSWIAWKTKKTVLSNLPVHRIWCIICFGLQHLQGTFLQYVCALLAREKWWKCRYESLAIPALQMSFVMGYCYITHGEVGGGEQNVQYNSSPISFTILLLINSMEAVMCNGTSCGMFLSMSDQHSSVIKHWSVGSYTRQQESFFFFSFLSYHWHTFLHCINCRFCKTT